MNMKIDALVAPRHRRPHRLSEAGRTTMRPLSRRDALILGAGSAALALSGSSALATVPEADAEIAKFTGGKTAEAGKIAIELPEIAENGNTVPLSIVVDSPMTDR